MGLALREALLRASADSVRICKPPLCGPSSRFQLNLSRFRLPI
jgi:hypothetical protein